MRRPLIGAALTMLAATALAAQARQRIFVFDQPFWINLHHYLYVLGRVEAKMPDVERRAVAGAPANQSAGLGSLDDRERQVWRESVAAYAAGLSRRDAVFDTEMVNATAALIKARGTTAGQIPGLEPGISAVLVRAAPVYRKGWWTGHEAANQRRIQELERVVADHGQGMLAFITRAYQENWPADGYPVRIAAYSNWAGAYSTREQILIMSSLDEETRGVYGLETVFHEAMHQWDDAIDARLRAVAKRAGLARVPDNLTHAMIFYTAGEAARRAVPDHAPYAERNGMWKQGRIAAFRDALDRHWKPYLGGAGSLETALESMLRAVS